MNFAGIFVDIYLSDAFYENFLHGIMSARSHIFDKFGKVVLYNIVSDDVDARRLRLIQLRWGSVWWCQGTGPGAGDRSLLQNGTLASVWSPGIWPDKRLPTTQSH